jgi:hypothetical protein
MIYLLLLSFAYAQNNSMNPADALKPNDSPSLALPLPKPIHVGNIIDGMLDIAGLYAKNTTTSSIILPEPTTESPINVPVPSTTPPEVQDKQVLVDTPQEKPIDQKPPEDPVPRPQDDTQIEPEPVQQTAKDQVFQDQPIPNDPVSQAVPVANAHSKHQEDEIPQKREDSTTKALPTPSPTPSIQPSPSVFIKDDHRRVQALSVDNDHPQDNAVAPSQQPQPAATQVVLDNAQASSAPSNQAAIVIDSSDVLSQSGADGLTPSWILLSLAAIIML